MYKEIKYQIHATNINGLGAKNVAEEVIRGLIKRDSRCINYIYISNSLANIKFDKKKIFKRFLPNSISRIIEIFFAKIYFDNIKTLVLGDIPLYGISNQIILDMIQIK